MPNSNPLSSLAKHTEAPLCAYRDARGRGCRIPVISAVNHPSLDESSAPLDGFPADGLCAFHARRALERQRAAEATATELLASVPDFTDAASVNRVLGNLLKLVAHKRIPHRDAIALAYIAQLLLNSLAAQDRKKLLDCEVERLNRVLHPPRVVWDLGSSANRQD